jgi:hypothetical protein
VSAKGREPHNHEITLSDSFGQLVAVMEADDPGAVAIDPFLRLCDIQPPMRRAEIQEQRDLGRRKMSLANWFREKARARKETSYKRAKIRMGFSLHHPPLSQLRCVLVYLHADRAPSITARISHKFRRQSFCPRREERKSA